MESLDNIEIELALTVGEGNLILSALSELPFKTSFGLIHKIKQQAEQQVETAQTKPANVTAPAAVRQPETPIAEAASA